MVDQTLNTNERIVETPKENDSQLPESLTKIEWEFSESLQQMISDDKLTSKEIDDLISCGINMNEKCIQDFVLYCKEYNISGYMWFARFCSISLYWKELTSEECWNRAFLIKKAIEHKCDSECIYRLIDIYNYMYEYHDNLINDSKENSQEVSDLIFNKIDILRELCFFGYVPDGKGNLVPNAELNKKINTVNNLSKILTPEDIDIMHQMVNIWEHKSFWKSLKPWELIEIYLKLKDLFIPHLSTKNYTNMYTDPLSKTEWEEFISKIIDQIEKKNISETEKHAIDNYVWHSYETWINTEIEKRIEWWKDPNMNWLPADLINAINLYNLIERNEINEPMKLNRVERSGWDRITNTVKLHDWTTLKTILNNFDQYIDKVNEINEELKNITLNNNKFMSTSFWHDYNYFNDEWLWWDIYLQEGSHAILTNVYANAWAWNGELEYIVQAWSEITFQIEVKKNWMPQLIWYVKTP